RESTDAFREVVTTYLTDQIARRVLVIKDVGTAVQLFVSVTTGQIRERMLLGERPSSIEIEAQVKEGVRMFLAWCKSK
ncbi:TetR/AcrR family transcriptional regulator C-terminal domain-containing protein, partial [Escherichia coli]